MPELTPLDDNRQEHFLNGEDLEPITRREHFYAGRESELPAGHQEPETREEWFIQKYRGGGGDVTVVPLSVTDNGTYSEEGKAYSPVSVNVPLPQNAYLLKSVANLPQAIASFNDGEDMVMPSLKVAIEPQQGGSGDPSPTNVRPISGWDEANVSVSGVNVWDEEWEVGSISDASGQDATNSNYRRSKNYISVKANKKYYFNVPSKYGTTYRFYQYKQNKDYIGIKTVDSDGTFETDNDCAFIRFRIATTEDYTNDISINYPSTDTSYHAYNGATYTIDLDGTRYGGELDVVSGVLTVDRGYVDLGSFSAESWTRNGVQMFWSHTIEGMAEGTANVMCSEYKYVSKSWTTLVDYEFGVSSNSIRLHNENVSTKEELANSLDGVQLVYELATPLTIQLTPTAVKSLLGSNNVWADTGDITDAEYFSKEV